MSEDLAEFGLFGVSVTIPVNFERMGDAIIANTVQRIFVVSPDPDDPKKPDRAELKERVREWKLSLGQRIE